MWSRKQSKTPDPNNVPQPQPQPPPQQQPSEDSPPPSPQTDDTALLVPPDPSTSSKSKTPKSPSNGSKKYLTFPSSSSSSSSSKPPERFQDASLRKQDGDKNDENSATATTTTTKRGNSVFVSILACFAAIGGLLFGYDTGIISGSMLLIKPYFELSTFWQEVIVSGTIWAAAVSSLVGGVVCDRVGRKGVIMAASLIFTVGAVVMGAAPNKEALLGGRIIVGVGIGLASVSVPVYTAECAPPDIRGLLVTIIQLFITLGILISSIVAGAFSTMTDTGWRYMLGLAGVPGVIQFCAFLFLPESPRWLVSVGREEDARRVLIRVRGHHDVEDEMAEIKEADNNKQTGFVLGQMLKTPHVRRALVVGCGLQLFQQLCGINTVIYYSGTILKEAGFEVEQAIWLVCIPFSINFMATFIGMAAVERVGRKILLLFSFVGVTVALVILSVGFLLTEKFSPPVNTSIPVLYHNGSKVTDQCQGYSVCEDCISEDRCGYCYDTSQPEMATCLLALEDDPDNSAAYGRCSGSGNGGSLPSENQLLEWTHGFCPTDYAWLAVLGLALFVFSFAPGLGPMPWTINSEIYPMWARSTGMSLATMTNWTCNLLVSFTFLTLFDTITKYGTFFMFTGISVLGFVFTIFLVPETKNKTLEEMEQVFMTSSPQLRHQGQEEGRHQDSKHRHRESRHRKQQQQQQHSSSSLSGGEEAERQLRSDTEF